MKSLLTVVLLLIYLTATPTHSQPTTGNRSGYRDFILNGTKGWLLTNSGEINSVDLISGKFFEPVIKTDAPIVAIAKDRSGNLVAGDTAHKIKQYDRVKAAWHTLSSYTGKLTGITFDSTNQCFAITNDGIVCVGEGKRYFPDSALYLNNQIRNKKVFFQSPSYLMDKRNQIWLGFDYGEWGGDVFMFDTQKRLFRRLQIHGVKMNGNPVSSFCEDPQNVYMSSGLSHIMMTHGSIIKFSDCTGTIILLSKDKNVLGN